MTPAESARGIAPRAAHRTGLKPLDLSGSCYASIAQNSSGSDSRGGRQCGYFCRQGAGEVGTEAEVSSLGRMPFFIVSQDQRPVGELGAGLPPGLSESERSAEAGRAGHDSVIGAGRALALGAHQRDSGRWDPSRMVGPEQSGERGLGATCDGSNPRGGRPRVAAEASESQL